MLTNRLIGAFLFLCASSASAQTYLDDSSAAVQQDVLNRAVASVMSQLRDPLSAQFRGLQHPDTGNPAADKERLCGYVNANNGFGGYQGESPFMFSRGKATIYIPEAEPNFDSLKRMVFQTSGCGKILGL